MSAARGGEADLAALLRALPVGVLRVEGGRVTAANPALAERLGAEVEALAGRSLASLFHGDDAPEVERRARAGAPWTGRARLAAAGGTPLAARLTVAPAPPGCWLVVDLGAPDDGPAGEREELVFLGSLVQSVVHDLRNPLQAAMFALSTLRATPATRSAESLGVLERKVREIEAILAELHECAQPWRPVLLPFPLGELVEGARVALADAARERQVELRVEPAGGVEVRVDPPRMKQALVNLARIAVEASPPGSAVVMRAGVDAARGGWIEVRDERQAPPGTDFTAGAGRGSRRRLAIARRTVEAHGGQLRVEPCAPRGARARVELPAGCIVPV